MSPSATRTPTPPGDDPTLRPDPPPLDWTPAGLRRRVPALEIASKPLRSLDVTAVVVGMRTQDKAARVAAPDAFTSKAVTALEEAAAKIRFRAKARTTARLPAPEGVPGDFVVLVGLGDPAAPAGAGEPVTSAEDSLRRAAAAGLRALSSARGTEAVVLVLPVDSPAHVRAVGEGALLGAYAFDWYRERAREARAAGDGTADTDEDEPAGAPGRVLIDASAVKAKRRELEDAAALATISAESVWLARDLVDLSPVDLSPAVFAEAAITIGAQVGLSVTVLDEQQLRAEGYGGLLAVGAGSSRPPRLVTLSWSPRRATRSLALVGKGITFDSGGLSLKPPASMPGMKGDMAGAAAVLAAIVAAARAQLPVAVTAYLALAENMPSGHAQRPSDVIRIKGGRTVEVLNTDAEGRLVLADALVTAAAAGPDAIVDVATLTGAQVVALGPRTSGLFSTDEALAGRIGEAAAAVGEPTWLMPMLPELRPHLDSAVADIANVSMKRDGGMVSAALFLREFVPSRGEGAVAWAHLDVAGPAFNEGGAEDRTPKGGTGVPTLTLLRLAESFA